MTELQLYKFITDKTIEYHKSPFSDTDFIFFVNNRDIDDWNTLLGSNITDEDGIECIMKDGYFCFYAADICDYFDIEIANVFVKENSV